MICEKCGKEHKGSYGSGRFCDSICARSFSTSKSREEINEKVSKKLGKYLNNVSKEELKSAISKTRSMAEASRELKLPYTTFKRLAKKYEIYDPEKWIECVITRKPFPLEKVMVENSTYSRTSLKKQLLKKGIKKEKCEICGFEGKWNGKPITFILDHINGINNDHRMENLRMICPMCNVQLGTFCSKNIINKKIIMDV